MSLRLNNWTDFVNSFTLKPELKDDHPAIVSRLRDLVVESVRKNISDGRFGILFSGGVDSSLIAQICKMENKDFICYTAGLQQKGMKEAEDITYAQKARDKFGFKVKIIKIDLAETEKYIKKVIRVLKDRNVVKVGVALPFYVAFQQARNDGIKVMLSGLGSEEIFAGYERHLKAEDVNQECFDGLLSMYERDITRDIAVAEHFGIDLRVPFLDQEVIGYSLKIPARFKLNGKDNKIILREVAEKAGLGLFAWRKKRAAQYGSKFDRAISKLAKRNGFKYKKDYLNSL